MIVTYRQDIPGHATSPTERGEILPGGPTLPTEPPEAVVEVGFRFPSTLTNPPTSDESQSKLWFHDGTWRGVLIESSTASVHLYRLESDLRSWTDTGLLIDERSDSRADVMWDGAHLYVASSGTASSDEEHLRVMRYSYDPDGQTYSLDPGFPIQLTDTGVRALTIAKDTAGVVGVSYIAQGQIWLNHTGIDDASWSDPFVLPGSGTSVESDDLAALVANGNNIGLVWTNQVDGAVYFTSHTDGEVPSAWDPTTTALAGTQLADTHSTARSLDGPNGSSLFVVVKTSLDLLPDHQPTDVQMLLSWS